MHNTPFLHHQQFVFQAQEVQPAQQAPEEYEESEMSDRACSPTLSEEEVSFFGHRISQSHPLDGVPAAKIDPLLLEEARVANQLAEAARRHARESQQHALALELESTDTEDGGDTPPPVSPIVKIKKRSRPAPHQTSTPPVDAIVVKTPVVDSTTLYEVVVWVLQPSKRSKGSRKVPESKPLKFGPFETTSPTFPQLLDEVADAAQTMVDCLRIGSLEWRWLKPANSEWMPLRDSKAFTSLLKQIKSKNSGKNAQVPYMIIVRMDIPLTSPSTAVVAPWAIPSKPGPLIGVADEKDEESDDERNHKKARFDDGVEEIVVQIDDKYSVGLCPQHSTEQCFHHRPTDLHFLLTRSQKIAWASYIRQGKATLLSPPIGSNFFTSKHAAKPVRSLPTSVPAQPGSPSLSSFPGPSPLQFQGFPGMSFNPYAFYGMGMPSATPPGHLPHGHPLLGAQHSAPADPRSSPPPENGSLDEFCARYNLGKDTQQGLQQLGFEIGDDLNAVTETQWERAGFLPLVWQRVCKAYRKYKNELRA